MTTTMIRSIYALDALTALDALKNALRLGARAASAWEKRNRAERRASRRPRG